MLYSKCICKHGFLLKTQVRARQTRHVTEAHRRAEHLLVEGMYWRASCEHSFKKFVWNELSQGACLVPAFKGNSFFHIEPLTEGSQ